jgi:hypothetical protein
MQFFLLPGKLIIITQSRWTDVPACLSPSFPPRQPPPDIPHDCYCLFVCSVPLGPRLGHAVVRLSPLDHLIIPHACMHARKI